MEDSGGINVSNQFDNSRYITPTALALRLDTSELISNIAKFLSGTQLITDQDENGNLITKKITVGKAKANDLGLQSILNYIQSIINPSVVQGNFPSERKGYSPQYEQYISETHIELSKFLMVNLYNWNIVDDDYDVIIDFIMRLVIAYMTRLIDNKEREGYDQNLRTTDSVVAGKEPKGLSGMLKGVM